MPEVTAKPVKPKAKLMVASDLGPRFSKIEKPDPTKGQTVGRTPWNELQREMPEMFDGGKYHGPGRFPPDTMAYFDFAFKGQQAAKLDRSCYMVTQKLLDDLASNAPHLTVLDVENRQLIDLEMLKIFEALATNSTVVQLKLAHNSSDEAVGELAQVLKTNRSITKVDISSNDIHDKGISALGEMLKTNSTLQELDLSSNFCRSETSDLAVGVAANRGLTKLNLNVSQIDDAGALALQAALVHNKTLRELTGFNNPVVNKELRKWLKNARRAPVAALPASGASRVLEGLAGLF